MYLCHHYKHCLNYTITKTVPLIQKIRTSFTTQLTILVAGFVTIITTIVITLLAIFSQEVIQEETVDATMQALENTALLIDNNLKLTEMSARLENNESTPVNRERIERIVEEDGSLAKFHQSLPNAKLSIEETKTLASMTSDNGSGFIQAVINREDFFIFYHPLPNHDYTVVVKCPSSDLYSKYAYMQRFLVIRSVIGVLILFYILYLVVGRHLRPLHRLADSAQSISEGNLDTIVIYSHHEDELSSLQHSLIKMQHSLKSYLNEMQQKQEALSHQNEELKAAYNEIQAYEGKKAQFLREMAAQMAQPVVDLCHQTEAICRDISTLNKEEMGKRQISIMQNTEAITKMLDQLKKNTDL